MNLRAATARHGALIVALAFATEASAAELSAPPSPQGIYGGDASESCAWPTAVSMEGCTGTLVHPEIVVFAAHCLFFAGGVAPTTATFGESVDAPQRVVDVVGCTMWPDWVPDPAQSAGHDIGVCQLAEPVLDVEIVPILMGCENEVLAPGQEVTLVGFGVTDTGAFGIKHEVVATVNGIESDEVNLGGGGTSSCNGDSGGPAYVQLEDGSWRVFGITSRGTSGDCNDPSYYGQIGLHAEWIEKLSGIDITPCHDADGTWNPSDACTEFPLDPGVAASDWKMGCGGAPPSGPSQTCGEPFGGGGESSTGEADTGLDESGTTGDGETGLPGGTAAASSSGSSGSGTTTDTDGSAQDGDGDGCSCRSNQRSPAPLLLLPILAWFRRRRPA